MVQLLFKKWWLILIQGILLIILSIYIFNNPVTVLAGISVWFGLLVLAAGIIGILAWITTDKIERRSLTLLWSIATTGLGLLMLMNILATMKILTVIFGLWMLITGFHLTSSGWSIKKTNSLGWIMVIAGVISIVVSLMIIFNIGTGAVGISTLLGLQVLLTGIALILLSFAKKAIISMAMDKIEILKSKIKEN